MMIKTTRSDLIKPLLQVSGIVERRQTLPILANVLIVAREDHIDITATDLEIELRTRAVASSETEMEFTIPARKLLDICKALPEDASITAKVENDKVTLRSGRGRYTLGMLSAQDYPNIEPTALSEVIEVPEIVLKKLIERVQFAMAQQDVRYYLNGMLFEVRPGRIRTVATDGHRLALCDEVFKSEKDVSLQVILPRKAVNELGRLLAESEKLVRLEVSSSHIRVHLDDATFTSKLIDGRFPDYERVMPTGTPYFMKGDKGVLRQALTRTAILSNEKYRGIRFKVSEDLLHLQAHNPEQDEAEEEVEVEYTGPEIMIGFNVSYLLDVLSVLQDDVVEIAVTDENSSALITPPGKDDCRYVVMPMRL